MKKVKSVVFLSNYFNHHQQPVSDAFFAQLGIGYHFIETSEMSDERKRMGWGIKDYPPYVVTCSTFDNNKEYYKDLIKQADVVIIGAAPISLVRPRLRNNKLTFVYAERPLKKGFEIWKYPYRFLRWRLRGYSKRCVYLLGASAYAAQDFGRFFLFRGRSFAWGYFPPTYRYDSVDKLLETKSKNSIIWVARFLELKHPEMAVELGKRLKQDGYSFHIDMIGNGCMQNDIAEMIQRENLETEIHLLGSMLPEDVRAYMEKAEIHIFTSDRNEGWGAVLNESMNSGCVPVADINIGSAPFLIKDGKNGLVYSDFDEFYDKVKYLLDRPEKRKRLGLEAYRTITENWNAETAAERLLELSEHILNGEQKNMYYPAGVCSTESFCNDER